MVHCLSVNDYGQPERSRKFHSPLHPDIMDLDKKKIDDEGQPVTVKSFLMWNVSAPGDGGSTYPYGHLRSIPTHPPPLPSPRVFLPYFCQSVISLFKNISYSINSFSDGHCKFFITWQTKKLKFLLNNKVKNPTPLPSCAQRHVRLHLGMNGRNLPPA